MVGKKAVKIEKRMKTSEAVANARTPKLLRDFIAGSLVDNLSPHGKDPACGRLLFQLDQLFVMALS